MNQPHEAMSRLPKRLTVSFPLWLIYGTRGEDSPYYDIDKAIWEHVERGFNCMRIDSGAGLVHDLEGNRRPPFDVGDMFGEYEKIPRQEHILGDGGACDLLERLIEVFACAKKYGVYIILSQWYYLHTYWLHKVGDPLGDELFAIPVDRRFDAFRRFWHYILLELERRGLDSQIAFVEIFNEADEHPYLCGERKWGANRDVTEEEAAEFLRQHEEVLEWLEREHPTVMFGYDAVTDRYSKRSMPKNSHVYNFHNYYMWSHYKTVMGEHPEWFRGRITPSMVELSRKGRRPVDQGWYDRVAQHNDLDPARLQEVEECLEKRFHELKESYVERMEHRLRMAVQNAEGRPIVCGEGVSYICSKEILWEEHSEAYWETVRLGLQKYKEAGVWGTVIRTCCGPEDPCWTVCKDKLLRLNRFFLED